MALLPLSGLVHTLGDYDYPKVDEVNTILVQFDASKKTPKDLIVAQGKLKAIEEGLHDAWRSALAERNTVRHEGKTIPVEEVNTAKEALKQKEEALDAARQHVSRNGAHYEDIRKRFFTEVEDRVYAQAQAESAPDEEKKDVE